MGAEPVPERPPTYQNRGVVVFDMPKFLSGMRDEEIGGGIELTDQEILQRFRNTSFLLEASEEIFDPKGDEMWRTRGLVAMGWKGAEPERFAHVEEVVWEALQEAKETGRAMFGIGHSNEVWGVLDSMTAAEVDFSSQTGSFYSTSAKGVLQKAGYTVF